MTETSASVALTVIRSIKADMALGTVASTATCLEDLDSRKYLSGVEDVAEVSLYVNIWFATSVWLAARP